MDEARAGQKTGAAVSRLKIKPPPAGLSRPFENYAAHPIAQGRGCDELIGFISNPKRDIIRANGKKGSYQPGHSGNQTTVMMVGSGKQLIRSKYLLSRDWHFISCPGEWRNNAPEFAGRIVPQRFHKKSYAPWSQDSGNFRHCFFKVEMVKDSATENKIKTSIRKRKRVRVHNISIDSGFLSELDGFGRNINADPSLWMKMRSRRGQFPDVAAEFKNVGIWCLRANNVIPERFRADDIWTVKYMPKPALNLADPAIDGTGIKGLLLSFGSAHGVVNNWTNST